MLYEGKMSGFSREVKFNPWELLTGVIEVMAIVHTGGNFATF